MFGPVTEFREDLKKLTWFCRNTRYYRGIFLLYGVDERESETPSEHIYVTRLATSGLQDCRDGTEASALAIGRQ